MKSASADFTRRLAKKFYAETPIDTQEPIPYSPGQKMEALLTAGDPVSRKAKRDREEGLRIQVVCRFRFLAFCGEK